MNILQICNKVPLPPKDGGSIAVMQIAEGLQELSNTVSILSLNTKKHYINTEQNKHQFIDIQTFDIDTSISPFHLVSNFLFSGKPYNAQRFICEGFAQKIKLTLKKKLLM